MSEVKTKEICESIMTVLKEESPLTLTEIAERVNMSKARCLTFVRVLIEENRIVAISSKNGSRVYYTINKEATLQDIGNMHVEIVKETVEAKDTYKNLEEKYQKMNDNLNGIYANLVSLMSIFVAIFSLITVNANIAFELTTQNMPDIFWGIVKINGFVVICIIALLFGVRKIIIDPMLDKTKDKSEK